MGLMGEASYRVHIKSAENSAVATGPKATAAVTVTTSPTEREYLQQAITWNHVVGFALIAGGAFFVFRAPI